MKNFALFPLPLGSWLHHSRQYKYVQGYGLYECELPNELTTTVLPTFAFCLPCLPFWSIFEMRTRGWPEVLRSPGVQQMFLYVHWSQVGISNIVYAIIWPKLGPSSSSSTLFPSSTYKNAIQRSGEKYCTVRHSCQLTFPFEILICHFYFIFLGLFHIFLKVEERHCPLQIILEKFAIFIQLRVKHENGA